MNKIRYLIVYAGVVAASTSLLLAQNDNATGATSTNLFDMLMDGGWAMIPLALTCSAMFFLVFYCFMETSGRKFIPLGIIPKLQQELQIRDITSATNTLLAAPCLLSRAMLTALTKARPDWPDSNKEKVELTLVESLEAEDSAYSAWVNYLNVVAAIAPMIGLLGTVSGMIGAFQTIGTDGMGDPSKLAGDIGQALITTATGLVIGIPAMVFYFYFKNRLTARMINTTQTASTLIDYLAGEYGYEDYAVEEMEVEPALE